jgi:hypothetical protein
MKYTVFEALKLYLNGCFFIAFLLSLPLISCKEKRHHLLEDVGKSVQHEEDTIGWSMILEEMHGVWVQRKYSDLLERKRSITAANQLAASTYTVINVDSRQFLGDSLPFVALNANDFAVSDGCFYFYKDERDGSFYIEVESRHPVIGVGNREILVGFEKLNDEYSLVLEQEYEGGFSDKDRYMKVSWDVSDKLYDYDPMLGIEMLARKYLQGRYNVYDENNNLVMRAVDFRPDGTIGNHPFAKYRTLVWSGFDALMIDGLATFEEQNRENDQYFGLKIVENDLELYGITLDKEKREVMGDLKFRMRKR